MDVIISIETVFENGKRRTHRLGRLSRPYKLTQPEGFGLLLEDAKTIVGQLQKAILFDQIEEISEASRVCLGCKQIRAIHDTRTRVLDTLFGQFEVKAPRIRLCRCQENEAGENRGPISPLTLLFPARATPELQRIQADLGSRHSFREAARLMAAFLPCRPQLNTTTRNRLGRIARKLELAECALVSNNDERAGEPVTVFLDGAHIRCRPEYQKRHLDVVVGKIESHNISRRFGLVTASSGSPNQHIRKELSAVGWRQGTPVTVLSDGEPALPNLIRNAVGQHVTHILDWWHISMRVKHIENAATGLAQHCLCQRDADDLTWIAERLRWWIWHGKSPQAIY